MASKKKQLRRDLVLMRTERDQALERLTECQADAQVTEGLLDAARQDLANEQAARRRDASTWEDQRAEGLRVNQRLTEDRDRFDAEARRIRDAATMEANTLRDTIEVLNANLETATAAEAEAVRESQARGARIAELEGQNRTITQQMVTVGDERNRFADESRRRGACLYELASQLGVDMPPHEPGETIPVNMPGLRERITDLHARATRAETVLDASSTVSSELARYETENTLLRSDIHAIAEALGMADDPYEPGGAERLDNLELLDRIKELRSGLTPFINTAEHAAALGEIRSLRTALEGETQRRRAAEAEKAREVEKKDAARRDADQELSQRMDLEAELVGVRSQIDKLAEFIMDEVPGEPSRSEGSVDCAIRLITGMMGYLEDANPAELASIGITPGWRGRPKALEPLTVVNRETPEVVLLGINTHAHIDMLRPALQQLSRELDRPVLISAFANGSTVSIPRVTMETLNPVVTRIEAPGDEAPGLIEQMLAETRTELKLPPVKGQSIPFFSSPADGRMTNHGTDVPPAPPSPHPAGLTTITALDADGTPSGPSLVVHACKAEPGDEKHCRGNSGRHHPHDWWDDHEFDPTRWHCDGSTTYELREGQCGWDVLGFACTLDAGHAPDGTGGHQSTGITSVVPRDSAPVGPPAFVCEADVYAPPSSEDLDDEGWIAQTTYDEPNEWQREKIAELADLLPEVDEELAETGAPELAEPTFEDSEGHIVRLAEPEGQVRRYAARDESQHDPAKVTDASEVSDALADVEAEAIATVEANAEDEAIADGFPSGAIVRDWLDGNRERIQQALTPHVSGLVTEATDDLIDALAPPPDAPAS